MSFVRSHAGRYATALLAVGIALLIYWGLVRTVGPMPTFITFYPAAMLVALLCGLGPGLLASALASLVVAYAVLPPPGFAVHSAADIASLIVFFVVCASFSAVAARYRRARESAVTYRLELATQESSERFRVLFENMSEGVAVNEMVYRGGAPVDYRILEVNPAFERHTGFSAQRANGKLATDLYGADAAPYLEHYARVAETGEPLSFETYFAPMDRFFTIAVTAPLRGVFATILSDITARKRAEDALRERVKELTCLFEFSRMIERPGIGLEDILRETAELLPSAFHYPDVACARVRIGGEDFASSGFVASRWGLTVPLALFGEPTGSLEVCYREERPAADDGPFLTEELALLKTVAQRLEHVVERYRAATRLQASEERFALAARGANDGILDWDLLTDQVMLSPRWKSMLGYDEEELTDSVATWDALLHPDDRDAVWQSLSRYLADGSDIYEGESRLRHKDGHYVPVLTRGFALRAESDGAALRFTGTNTDLSEVRAMEASMHDAIEELRRSNQELEQFAYVASHDLQEPLRMVASFTQLLARRYADKLDQDAQDFIGYAVDGATRMQQLIQDLLAYSRVTTRGAPPEPVDVRGTLDQALRNLETAISESGATVTADDLPTVVGDRAQIVQLLQNLIGNSIKFRRPEVSPHVHLSAQLDPNDDSLWVFQVADDGIGIDFKYADRVFVIFQRLHGRQEYPGTGIGLALCKRIVERHGGAIWLQPDRADGTTISFSLPKAESASS